MQILHVTIERKLGENLAVYMTSDRMTELSKMLLHPMGEWVMIQMAREYYIFQIVDIVGFKVEPNPKLIANNAEQKNKTVELISWAEEKQS